ncbi:MAG: hypothetical protein U1D30_23850 [Planctomycetota bacterium]
MRREKSDEGNICTNQGLLAFVRPSTSPSWGREDEGSRRALLAESPLCRGSDRADPGNLPPFSWPLFQGIRGGTPTASRGTTARLPGRGYSRGNSLALVWNYLDKSARRGNGKANQTGNRPTGRNDSTGRVNVIHSW